MPLTVLPNNLYAHCFYENHRSSLFLLIGSHPFCLSQSLSNLVPPILASEVQLDKTKHEKNGESRNQVIPVTVTRSVVPIQYEYCHRMKCQCNPSLSVRSMDLCLDDDGGCIMWIRVYY
ncbi:hypothetical protein AVEN_238613-1 [Araneus ventricosus]|uniref:Uncharacterized protein n=1 Tax=Araneus ventricosus TaxID=182803 RepID=A0A4Y2Q033_ARAVE|nr:hypothetical protein AVEN_238613-1 [Araneus ventricosus]